MSKSKPRARKHRSIAHFKQNFTNYKKQEKKNRIKTLRKKTDTETDNKQ